LCSFPLTLLGPLRFSTRSKRQKRMKLQVSNAAVLKRGNRIDSAAQSVRAKKINKRIAKACAR
jgi:tRNA(Leu) C34 or U34 (ribose-2'-O)-methylase TrmL